MQISIVVPTYRRPELLMQCLAALARQRFPAEEFEVVVADDAADEATRRQIESLGSAPLRIHYIAVTGRHGPAAARNAGWRAARGEIIAFTDDDCVPDSAWLAAGAEPFIDPAVVAVTGQTIVPLPPTPTDFERNLAGLEQSEFITANCFCRRQVLLSLDGFDERFTAAWREDSDLHFRLLDAGGKIVRATAAVVVHPVRQAAWGVSLREQRKAVFEALLFRKHPRHFRERIRPAWPGLYYVMILAACAAAGALAMAHLEAALGAASERLLPAVKCCASRLRGTSRRSWRVAEMALTSAVIPF